MVTVWLCLGTKTAQLSLDKHRSLGKNQTLLHFCDARDAERDVRKLTNIKLAMGTPTLGESLVFICPKKKSRAIFDFKDCKYYYFFIILHLSDIINVFISSL